MDPNDNSFPVRSLNTFDNASYQAERRLARKRQMEQMQQAFESASDLNEFDDSISNMSAQTAPASFSRRASTGSVKKARDLVTDLYSTSSNTGIATPPNTEHRRHSLSPPSSSSHHRRNNNIIPEEHVNLAPIASEDAEEHLPNDSLMEDVEIQGTFNKSSRSRVRSARKKKRGPAMDGGWCMGCGYSMVSGLGLCVESVVACWAKRTPTQRALIAILLILIPILAIVIGVVVGTSNSSGGSSSNNTPTTTMTASGISGLPDIVSTPINANRFSEIQKRIINADVLSTEEDMETFGTPANLALLWLTDYDDAKLDTDHQALLQRYALAVLYFATHKQTTSDNNQILFTTEWSNDEHWMTEKGICMWKGITCPAVLVNGKQVTTYNDNTAVLHLNLTEQNLIGSIPSQLRALENLKLLDLHSNLLKGSIPTQIGQLKELVNIHLQENKLTGFLPSEVGVLRNLQNFHCGDNQLEGPVPTQISLLRGLESLGLDRNYFSGTLPDFSRFENMLFLYLDNNAFSGTIPDEVENLDSLVDLRLTKNFLVGSLPSTLFKLYRLELMYLGDNDLTGEVPDLFDEMDRLKQVHLYKNLFTGTLPESMGESSVLEVLYMDNNQFVGNLPSSWGDLDDLKTLYLSNNQLTGEIPSTIQYMKNLKDLHLHQNKFEGEIPNLLSNAFNLEVLYVHDNKFVGPIPKEFGELDRLEAFRFYRNEISGVMPQEVCDLRVKSLKFLAGDCDEETGSIICDCCHECF